MKNHWLKKRDLFENIVELEKAFLESETTFKAENIFELFGLLSQEGKDEKQVAEEK